MEYSLNTAFLGDIESMVHRFINDSIKNSQSPNNSVSNSVNQNLRDVIERYIRVTTTTSSTTNAVDFNSNNNSSNFNITTMLTAALTPNDDNAGATSTAIITPGTPTALKMEELGQHAVNIYEDDAAETKAKGARKIHCSECPRILLSRKNFIKHAEDEHGMILPIIHKSFDDQKEFDKWMSYLREERQTEFVSKCGRKRLSNGSLLGYLVCSKGGCGGEMNNRKKTAKSFKTCAAYLKVLRNEISGKIDVEGCIEHTGHDLVVGSTTCAPTMVGTTSALDDAHGCVSFSGGEDLASLSNSSSEAMAKETFTNSNHRIDFNQQQQGTTNSNAAGRAALDLVGLCSGASNIFDALPSSLAIPSFSASSLSGSSSTLNTSSNTGRTMLSAEILCNFLNAVKQGALSGGDHSQTLPQFPVKEEYDLTSYQNAPTPPSSTTTFIGNATSSGKFLKAKIEEADAPFSDEMIASSSSEILQDLATPSTALTPDANGFCGGIAKTSANNTYVDVELERRKLALVEKFQTSIQKIDKTTIDGAEVAMRFFLRELDGLCAKSSL